MNIMPRPNTAITITQLDGKTVSDGRQTIRLTIGNRTHEVDVHIHPNAPCAFLLGRFSGSLFGLDIDLRLNQVFQYSAKGPHLNITYLRYDKPICASARTQPESECNPSIASACKESESQCNRSIASSAQKMAQRTLPTVPHASASACTQLIRSQSAQVMAQSKHDSHLYHGASRQPLIPQPISGQPHQASLQAILARHRTVFASSPTDIGRISIASHYIRLQDNVRPIALRPYRHSAADLSEIRRQVSELLRKGLIRPSKSPWAFPTTLAPKSDGTKRLCIDFRSINSVTVNEREPIPIVQDIIDQLNKARVFTVLDMAWGYWHVPMHPDSIEKTAFVTPDGQYEWLVLPFGLKNAPSSFQRIIRQVLGDLVNNGVVPYFDDIIIYATDESEHNRLLLSVLERLSAHNIKLRYEKCRFALPEVEYLGFLVGHGIQRPSPSKLKSVHDFPTPNTVKQVQRFIGLANYYRRFIQNFSRIAEPLTRLTRKGVPFIWTSEQQSAFNALKLALTTDPVVVIYREDRPVSLHTDASKVGIAGILMQPDDNGYKRVVAYYSRLLNKHEQNYSASELEVLAVVESMEYFHIYVHGKHCDIFSDHSALQWLFSIKKPSSRLFRWSVRLSIYDYTVHHRSGKTNQAADAISRAPISLFIDIDTIKREQSLDDTSSLRKLDSLDGLLINRFRGLKRIYIPRSLRHNILLHFHDQHGHPGINKTLQLITSSYWWESAHDDIVRHIKTCKSCQMVKPSSLPTLGKMHPPATPESPNHTWAIDTIVLGSSANRTRAKYVQLVVDHHSRYVWAFATPKNTTPTIINILSQLFNTVAKPKNIITDNFKSFTAKQFRSYLADRGIHHILSSPYHPQSNGICEKANDTIIRGLRIAHFEQPKLKWSTLLPQVVQNYNRTPHSATGFTPLLLHFNVSECTSECKRKCTTQCLYECKPECKPECISQCLSECKSRCTSDCTSAHIDINEARALAVQRSNRFKDKRKLIHDQRHLSSDFVPGDLVLRRLPGNHPSKNKLSAGNTGPYVVRRKVGPETYRISPEDDGSTIFTAHASQLVRFLHRLGTHDAGGVRCAEQSEVQYSDAACTPASSSQNCDNSHLSVSASADTYGPHMCPSLGANRDSPPLSSTQPSQA